MHSSVSNSMTHEYYRNYFDNPMMRRDDVVNFINSKFHFLLFILNKIMPFIGWMIL